LTQVARDSGGVLTRSPNLGLRFDVLPRSMTGHLSYLACSCWFTSTPYRTRQHPRNRHRADTSGDVRADFDPSLPPSASSVLLRVFRPIVFRAVRHWPIAAGVVAAIWTLETGQPLLVAACSAVLVG